jgi:Sec-independent protein translocase protein TatA
MLAFLGDIGVFELVVIAVVAVLVFGKDLPQAASKAYLQVRKLRGAVDDLRRDTGIDRELRNIERTVREAEWEARRAESSPNSLPRATPYPVAPPPSDPLPASPAPEVPPTAELPAPDAGALPSAEPTSKPTGDAAS